MSDLNDLIVAVDKDRRVASEVLTKLPELVTATAEEDVVFDIGTPVSVPSIKKLQAALEVDDLERMNKTINNHDSMIQSLIQETGRIAADAGLTRQTPAWNSIDLTPENEDSDGEDPLFRSQVENGIRFPYDGYLVHEPEPRYDDQCKKIGSFIIPNHTLKEENRDGSVSGGQYVNVRKYTAFEKKVQFTVRQWRYYYYGYYYHWWYRRYGYYYNATYTRTIPGITLNGSMIGQSFQVSSEKILIGLKQRMYNPGNYYIGSKPRIMITRSKNGTPDLSQVIAHGSYKEDSQLTASSSSTSDAKIVTIELDRPVLLKPNQSYSFVVVADSTWQCWYNNNQQHTGSLFYTQDGKYWGCDLGKDLCYRLIYADFGDTPKVNVELKPISLSGGIASIKTALAVENPENCNFSLEVSINDQWRPIGIISDITTLPPYTPVRAVFDGTRYTMPILDSETTQITAFRPDVNLRYISKPRDIDTGNKVKIIYELTGFLEKYHTFSPKLKDTEDNVIDPEVQEMTSSSDGQVTTVSCIFDIDEDKNYKHEIVAATQVATKLFDINSIIELAV